MTMESGTKLIWDKVDKTDPNDTKHVAQRGGFTAIDAYAQIKAATELFGPVGTGWGWRILDSKVEDGYTWVHTKIWYAKPDGDTIAPDITAKTFETFGGAKHGKSPDEAHKKALTDSITKGLSYLGFNADVFLGKFDDNKYIEKRAEDVKKETFLNIRKEKAADAADPLDISEHIILLRERIEAAQTTEELAAIRADKDAKDLIAILGSEQTSEIKLLMTEKIKEVS